MEDLKQGDLLYIWSVWLELYMRSVWKVSSYTESLENQLRGIDVTFQPIGGYLITFVCKVTFPWGYSRGSHSQ